MDDGLRDLINQTKEYKTGKEKKYKEDSRNRLLKISAKKIQTTMIGALSSIENHFGFLWDHDDRENLSSESEHMKQLYDDVRSEILDKGNNQIRNLEAELSQYDVEWLRYQMKLPVIPRNSHEGEENNG